ncbi:hypothetical protein GEY59_04545 [Salmonella enterica subsp. enterica serovar Mikawasima]|uniref:Uncharacterized protein n=6 Tax=Salmonella enterica I TaxID=59201 RepID=A0A5H6XZN4_SALET|nr:hypothetical protein [Salmonella enterica subsp. enterica serovar Mikawasima]EAA2949004.1 hypothetical protein [Salmonella enterica subsp. enterica serovar Heidelberg]EAA7605798.1 hypothetical protein [Salmonella enterica]EAB5613781.1 hypothetical protein [Salmonella enterica subsp. enterica serovar Coeln]EAW2500044.1 hypothetical protein [Salmonella enterica subsp. enterica]EBF8153177.1 hypothetical protein [Salmonella enterica subsp. enterica serovar Adjame]EBG0416491.1 hypothetical prot
MGVPDRNRDRHTPRACFFIVVCTRTSELWWAVWGHRKVRRLVSRLRQPCTVHHQTIGVVGGELFRNHSRASL